VLCTTAIARNIQISQGWQGVKPGDVDVAQFTQMQQYILQVFQGRSGLGNQSRFKKPHRRFKATPPDAGLMHRLGLVGVQ